MNAKTHTVVFYKMKKARARNLIQFCQCLQISLKVNNGQFNGNIF